LCFTTTRQRRWKLQLPYAGFFKVAWFCYHFVTLLSHFSVWCAVSHLRIDTRVSWNLDPNRAFRTGLEQQTDHMHDTTLSGGTHRSGAMLSSSWPQLRRSPQQRKKGGPKPLFPQDLPELAPVRKKEITMLVMASSATG
jgi:hypothetical protein